MPDIEYYKYMIGEDVSDIFFTELNLFPNIHSPEVSGTIIYYELLQKIRYNLSVTDLLTYKYVDNQKNAAYDKLKSNKPAVCFNATFNQRKEIKNLQSITELMFLDIDCFNTKNEAEAYKKYCIEKYDWILSCNLSLSRTGLHLVIWVDEILDNKDFNKKYDFISKKYFDDKLDRNAKSLSRFTIIPYDFNVYINLKPKRLNIKEQVNQSVSYKKEMKVTSKNKIESNDQPNKINEVRGIEKSTWREKEKEKIMTTPCTFSSLPPERIFSTNKQRITLTFEESIAGLQFNDPNEPVYFRDGKEIIKINLFSFLRKNVEEGQRTATLGALAMKMIYLNMDSNKEDDQLREALLRYMLWLNKQICNPPLPYQEVLNSFQYNWNKYLSGDMDVRDLSVTQRSFWSPDCTLESNEKRKISCKLFHEPEVAESKSKISEAIEVVHDSGEKITQKQVARVGVMSVQTVKKYWAEYESQVKELNQRLVDYKTFEYG